MEFKVYQYTGEEIHGRVYIHIRITLFIHGSISVVKSGFRENRGVHYVVTCHYVKIIIKAPSG